MIVLVHITSKYYVDDDDGYYNDDDDDNYLWYEIDMMVCVNTVAYNDHSENEEC